MKPPNYHPAARRELRAAFAHYAESSQDAADGFYAEAIPAVDLICLQPRLYPPYLYGTQRLVLQRYPFSAV